MCPPWKAGSMWPACWTGTAAEFLGSPLVCVWTPVCQSGRCAQALGRRGGKGEGGPAIGQRQLPAITCQQRHRARHEPQGATAMAMRPHGELLGHAQGRGSERPQRCHPGAGASSQSSTYIETFHPPRAAPQRPQAINPLWTLNNKPNSTTPLPPFPNHAHHTRTGS